MKELLKLLEMLDRKRTVGTLVLGRRARSCDLFVEEDRIYYAAREYAGKVDMEGLARAGVMARRLQPHQLDAIISSTNLTQKPLPEALLEGGYVNVEERAELLRQHLAEEVFAQAFRRGGSFSFQEGKVPEHLLGQDPEKPSLALAGVIQLLKTRDEALRTIEELIPSRKEVFVVTEKGMAYQHAAADDFGLAKIFHLIDGFRDLNQIIRDVVFFDFYVIARMAVALQSGHLKKTVLPETRDISLAQLEPAEAERLVPAFKAAVKHAVDEVAARERLGALYERLGNLEEAVIQYNFIGDTLYRMKKVPKALKAFQRALEIRPTDLLMSDKVIKIYQETAEEAMREGRRDAALDLLRAAVRIRPDKTQLSERLLSLYLEAADLREASEICEEVVARSRSSGSSSSALLVLTKVIEKFPGETAFRKKLINLYLDLGMKVEAVTELENLADQESGGGQTSRAQEILEKILKIDPGRDDIRRRLKAYSRRTSSRPALRGPLRLVKLFVLIALVAAGYQYWSYRELEEFRRPAVAHGQGVRKSNALVISPEERELERLAGGARAFQERYPLSVFRVEAQRLTREYRQELTLLTREREKARGELFNEAMLLAEKGRQAPALEILRRLAVAPGQTEWRGRAEEMIRKLEGTEKVAEEIRRQAETAAATGDWETAYRAAWKLLDEHPLSRAATGMELPILVRSVPAGALVKKNGTTLGPSPQVVRVVPGKPCEIEVEAEGFITHTEQVGEVAGSSRLVLLNRKPRWAVAAGAALKFPPVVSNDLVLAVLENGSLCARDREDGSERWCSPGRGVLAPVAPPLAVEGRLYLPFNDGEIVRFTPAGEVDQRIKSSSLISTRLLHAAGSLVFATSSGALVGWDLTQNRESWLLPLRAAGARLAPAIGGQLYVTTDKGQLFLVEATGRLLWEAPLGGKPLAPPVDLGKAVSVHCADRRLVVLDHKAGNIISRRHLPPPYQSLALVGAQKLLFLEESPETGSQVVEIDPMTAQETMRAPLPWPATGLFEAGAGAGVSLANGAFLVLEPGTYQPLWAYRPSAGRIVACTSDDVNIVLASDTGEIAIFDAARP